MEIDLSGRTAFVSGSTQGIGRAIVARLARSGGIAADVASPDGAEALFAALPAVDILVNNLGIFGPAPVLEVDDATWQR